MDSTINVNLPTCIKLSVSPVKHALKFLTALLTCIWRGKDAKSTLISFIRKKYQSSFRPSVDRMR